MYINITITSVKTVTEVIYPNAQSQISRPVSFQKETSSGDRMSIVTTLLAVFILKSVGWMFSQL